MPLSQCWTETHKPRIASISLYLYALITTSSLGAIKTSHVSYIRMYKEVQIIWLSSISSLVLILLWWIVLMCSVRTYVCMFAILLSTCTGLADSLIEALNDRDETVRQTIVTSLVDMGRHKLDVILSSGHSFLIKHPKVCHMCKRVVVYSTLLC